MAYRLKNSVIRDPGGRIKFRKLKEGGYEHYHIGVWLEADSEREMDRVSLVEYELHPSFEKRLRSSKNRSNDFSITFWSWGTFVIRALVHLVDKEAHPLVITHQLEYDLPADDGTNYVDFTGRSWLA
jgi:transcription initiation factor IIF auxiliary subunit